MIYGNWGTAELIGPSVFGAFERTDLRKYTSEGRSLKLEWRLCIISHGKTTNHMQYGMGIDSAANWKRLSIILNYSQVGVAGSALRAMSRTTRYNAILLAGKLGNFSFLYMARLIFQSRSIPLFASTFFLYYFY